MTVFCFNSFNVTVDSISIFFGFMEIHFWGATWVYLGKFPMCTREECVFLFCGGGRALYVSSQPSLPLLSSRVCQVWRDLRVQTVFQHCKWPKVQEDPCLVWLTTGKVKVTNGWYTPQLLCSGHIGLEKKYEGANGRGEWNFSPCADCLWQDRNIIL